MRPPVAHGALPFPFPVVLLPWHCNRTWLFMRLLAGKLQATSWILLALSLSLSGSISGSIKVKRRPSAEWGQFVSLHSFTHSLNHSLTHSVSQWGSHAVSWSFFRSVRSVSHWVSESSRRRRRRAGVGELGTQQRWKWKLRALYNFFFLWLIALS